MTNKELHIGIDLKLKMFNHNLLGRLLPEEKDYVYNSIITNLVHKTAEDARHSVINVESYADINAFYNVLEPFLITRELQPLAIIDRYSEYSLPKYIDVLKEQGAEIILGFDYKVEQLGNLNVELALLDFTLPLALVEDDILNLTIPNVTFIEYNIDDQALLTIFEGVKYKILRADGVDFTPYGASNNSIGTIFIANANHTYVTVLSTTDTPTSVLECMSYTPPTWTDIELIAVKNYGMFDFIAVNTLISTASYLTSTNNAKLVKGKFYRVSTAGEFTNLTNFGSAYNKVEVGYVFMATTSGTPTWDTDSPAVLEILTYSTCRFTKPQDISSFLEHSYGTTTTSPLFTMGDGKIQIYHDSKFSIVKATLIYVRHPAHIDSATDLETDINANLHPLLVNLAVADIVGTNNPQVYPIVKDQIKDQKTS